MKPIYPLQLHHSWPLVESGARFDLGRLVDDGTIPAFDPPIQIANGVGIWDCDLSDGTLTWSAAVSDLFGLPRDVRPSRVETVALYAERSRAAMERLRAHAIKHRRGFTLDAEIRPDRQERRWMRLIAAPVCRDGAVVRLHGLKLDVTHEYR